MRADARGSEAGRAGIRAVVGEGVRQDWQGSEEGGRGCGRMGGDPRQDGRG